MVSRFSEELRQALAAGCSLVTPNNRMARTLIRAHDDGQRAAGLPVWPTAAVLPYAAFVERLWRQLSTVMPLPRRLNAQACRVLWSEIVEQGTAEEAEPLLLYATAGAAALAQETWRLLHLWRAPTEETPWRHWRRESAGVTRDTARFARWAAQYHERLNDNGFIDEASVPDFIARHAACLRGEERAWVLTGFDDHPPQAARLLAALRAAGFAVTEVPSLAETTGKVFQHCARNTATELSDALSWAWQQVDVPARAGKDYRQVAIVIPALGAQERAVRWQVEDLLPEPALCNVSLGEPLAQKTLVATALELLVLIEQPLPVEQVAALLQSPYLPGDVPGRAGRASLARRWIECGQREVSWREVLNALTEVDPALFRRWREAKLPTRAATGNWPQQVLAWWQALGWPGSQTLDSVDYQVCQAWLRCLEVLPTLAAVSPQMTRQTLAQTLRQWAATTPFQPEGSDMPIQILGTLEAAGLPFAALWVAGLDGDSWPPPVELQPLLPPAWQRTCRLPRATVEQTLLHAGRTQAQWQRMAPAIVMSYPAERDGQPATASPLLTALPKYESSAIEKRQNRMTRLPPAALITLAEKRAPPVARDQQGRIVEAISQGSSVLAQQSDCPFKAFVNARLQAAAWPEVNEGLSPIERGNLIHAVLQKLWQRLGSQAALLALAAAAFEQQIDAVYQEVIAELKGDALERWRHLPLPIAVMEKEHITALLRTWCDVEKTRAPFQVTHTEKKLTLELAGMTFKLRADRVDILEDGGVILIDYKTGKTESTKGWFETRPASVQLGVYALAWQASPEGTAPVKAVVFAHLREEGAETCGITDDSAVWPQIEAVARFGLGEEATAMAAAQQRWREIFTALTQAFLAGEARIEPRHQSVCKKCGLESLCRIKTRENDDGEDGGGEGSDEKDSGERSDA